MIPGGLCRRRGEKGNKRQEEGMPEGVSSFVVAELFYVIFKFRVFSAVDTVNVIEMNINSFFKSGLIMIFNGIDNCGVLIRH